MCATCTHIWEDLIWTTLKKQLTGIHSELLDEDSHTLSVTIGIKFHSTLQQPRSCVTDIDPLFPEQNNLINHTVVPIKVVASMASWRLRLS